MTEVEPRRPRPETRAPRTRVRRRPDRRGGGRRRGDRRPRPGRRGRRSRGAETAAGDGPGPEARRPGRRRRPGRAGGVDGRGARAGPSSRSGRCIPGCGSDGWPSCGSRAAGACAGSWPGVAVLVALCVALLVLHTPLLAVRNATVRGASHTGTEAVLAGGGAPRPSPPHRRGPQDGGRRRRTASLGGPRRGGAALARQRDDHRHRASPAGLVRPARRGRGRGRRHRPGPGLAGGAAPGLVLVAPVAPGRPGTRPGRRRRGPRCEVAGALPASLAGACHGGDAWTHAASSRWISGAGSAPCWARPRSCTGQAHRRWPACWPGRRVSGPAVIDVTVPDEPTVGPPPPAVATVTKTPVTWVWAPGVAVGLLDRFAVPPYREGTSAGPGTHPNERCGRG